MGLSADLELEMVDWTIQAELMRHYPEGAPAWEPWEGEGKLQVYVACEPVELPLRVQLARGELRFPNLGQVTRAIERYCLARKVALALQEAGLAPREAVARAADLLASPEAPQEWLTRSLKCW